MMRRGSGPLRQHRRQPCQPTAVVLATAAVLVVFALYTLSRSSVFTSERGGPTTLSEMPSSTTSGNLAGQTSGSGGQETRLSGLSDFAKRHSSIKLETFQDENYPLPVAKSPPAFQNDEPGHITADQVKPLDMVTAGQRLRPQTRTRPPELRRGRPDVPLVVFVLLESAEEENEANFRYYVREAIREGDGCTHVILVHESRDLKALPRLPLENARYVRRRGEGCWLGALGELLQSPEVDTRKFTSFVLLTSRLRGPFVPAYAKELAVPWPSLLTSKLNNRTKLVGPLVTCQDISWPEAVPEAQRPHGQPYLPPDMLVTDQAGMTMLLEDGHVFSCHDAIKAPNPERYSALRAAQVVLSRGHTLDCLLQRYQGVQWAERENWGCNAGLEADGGEHYYDGISVHPMEVMFVEVAGMLLRKGLSSARTAKKYDKWKAAQDALSLEPAFNMYAFDPLLFRAAGIAYMEKRGPGCFDFGYYVQHNADVAGASIDEAWSHFVQSGQFEARLYRFNCVDLQARSFNCFDSAYYNRANVDLNQLRLEGRPLPPQEAWAHFLRNGFFEQRNYRFMDVCGEDIDSPNNLGEGMRH